MIIGIGNDLIDINRIERTITRYGNRFINRVFTLSEQGKSEKRVQRLRATREGLLLKKLAPKRLVQVFARGILARYGG